MAPKRRNKVETSSHGVKDFFAKLVPGYSAPPLHAGLERLNARLGFADPEDADSEEAKPAIAVDVHPTSSVARSIYYAPDMDGQAEPGEIVWFKVPSDGAHQPARDRAFLVVGHNQNTVLGLLISPNPEHAEHDMWLDIGSGEWDASGRPCWIRLDRVVEVSQIAIRRQGVLFPRRRFERVAGKLRSRFGWN